MTIHTSARFTNSPMHYHNYFEVNAPESQILANTEKVTNLAVANFKKKCEDYFKIEFGTMVFFEVYFFVNGIEKQIFKKEKLCTHSN
jgi:hypothetical protein